MTPRVVVLVSGGGSNLQALIDANLDMQIVLVVSNRKAAFALERAKSAGIPTLYAPLKPFTDAGRSRAEYDADLAKKIKLLEPDLIVLAGWMHVFTPVFLEGVRVPVINLHPALPGQFAGAHAIEDAYQAWLEGKITQSGCMVHHVIPELDAGEAIATRVVPFQTGDTLETYAERLHAAEHELIVIATNKTLVGFKHKRLVNTARDMRMRGAALESILDYLADSKLHFLASVEIIRELEGITLLEARNLVLSSPTWADQRASINEIIEVAMSEYVSETV